MIRHEDERIVEHDLHLLHVRDHVVRKIAAVKGHAFNDLQRRFNRIAEFNRDNAVITGPLESFGYHFPQCRVVGGNARNRAQTRRTLQGFGRTPQRGDRLGNRQFDPLDQFNRIGTGGE